MLRDRADGQIEIVIARPTVVGVMGDRDLAERFVAFLMQDEDVADEPSRRDLIRAVAETGDDLADAPQAAPAPRTPRPALLPALADRPRAPAMRAAWPLKLLSQEQTDAAFARIGAGEKLSAVAADIGTTMGSLHGLWARECRRRQQQLAEAGPQTCECGRDFMPSVTSPEKCARCARVA